MCFLADALWPPPSSSAGSLPTTLTNDRHGGETDGALGPQPTKSTDGISVNFYDDDDDDDDDEDELEEKLPRVEHNISADRFLLF